MYEMKTTAYYIAEKIKKRIELDSYLKKVELDEDMPEITITLPNGQMFIVQITKVR